MFSFMHTPFLPSLDDDPYAYKTQRRDTLHKDFVIGLTNCKYTNMTHTENDMCSERKYFSWNKPKKRNERERK